MAEPITLMSSADQVAARDWPSDQPSGLVLARETPAPRLSEPVAAYLLELAPSSQRTILRSLRTVAVALGLEDPAEIPWEGLRYAHVAGVRSKLAADGLAPSTINVALTAMKQVARHARNLGLIPSHEYDLIREVKPARGGRLPKGRTVRESELGAILEACARDSGAKGVRDAAIIATLYAVGLRRAELCTLDLADYDAASGELKVLHAKGNKQRVAHVLGGAAEQLDDWLSVRGSTPGRLFLRVHRSGKVSAHGLSPQAVYNLVVQRVKEAGLAKSASPHDFRRSFVSELLNRGADISNVQKLAGHADVSTTTRYDLRGEESRRRDAARLDVKYVPNRPVPRSD